MSWKRLQLGLIHAAVAMTLVPINSTLNYPGFTNFILAQRVAARDLPDERPSR